MTEWTYEDKEYWNRVYRIGEQYEKDEVVLDGNDGENEFDDKILNATKNRVVLDVGCGEGLFTLEIAKKARSVVGVDFSKEAIARTTKDPEITRRKNIRFREADASNLPFADEEFDIAISRRGPATANEKTVGEAHRVLKRNGVLMEITIGEKNTENLARIFGRGQMYGVGEKVGVSKRKMLERAGFRDIQITDYVATEIFPNLERLIIRLDDSPIIPGFNAKKDKRFLETVERRCSTVRGIETTAHRVTIVANK